MTALPAPANIEAEAAFLGAVLIQNPLLDNLPVELRPEHFFEPVHDRIFDRIGQLYADGKTVTPVTLRPYFEADEGLKVLGGASYLAQLTADGQGLLAFRELAEQIYDLAIRRRRLEWLEDEKAICTNITAPLREIVLPADAATIAKPLPCLDLSALATVKPRAKLFAIERIAPLAETTLFTGPGSAGKSLLGQQFATAGAAGLPCLGLNVQPGPALYLTCEDDADQLHWRQAHICDAMGVPMASLAGRLHLVSLRGELGNELATFTGDGKMTPAAAFQRVSSMLRKTGAKLAFLDNVAHLFTGNENDRGDVTRFVNLLNKMAGETGAAIVLLGHPNKQGDEWSGSTAWPNAVRSRIYLEHDEDTDLRTLTLPKANYGEKGEVVRFRWINWAFCRDDDLPADTRAKIAEVSKANGENAAFLRCLAQRTLERRHVSEKVGANYAPKVFATMAEAKGVKKDRLVAAMDRLFRIGAIERGFLWRDTAEGKDIIGLRKTGNATGNRPETRSANDRKPAENDRKTHPLDTTYQSGAALEAAAPSEDPFDPGDREGE